MKNDMPYNCIRIDTLTEDCEEYEDKDQEGTTATTVGSEISETLGDSGSHQTKEALLWLACLTVVVTGIFILLMTGLCLRRYIKRQREAGNQRGTGHLEGVEECKTLRKNEGRSEASPSTGSQGTQTGLNIRNNDSGCRDSYREEVWDGWTGSLHWDPGFPLPATELGTTALVTTKTTADNLYPFIDDLAQSNSTDGPRTASAPPPSPTTFHPSYPLPP